MVPVIGPSMAAVKPHNSHYSAGYCECSRDNSADLSYCMAIATARDSLLTSQP